MIKIFLQNIQVTCTLIDRKNQHFWKNVIRVQLTKNKEKKAIKKKKIEITKKMLYICSK